MPEKFSPLNNRWIGDFRRMGYRHMLNPFPADQTGSARLPDSRLSRRKTGKFRFFEYLLIYFSVAPCIGNIDRAFFPNFNSFGSRSGRDRHFQWRSAIENVRNRQIAFAGSLKETSREGVFPNIPGCLRITLLSETIRSISSASCHHEFSRHPGLHCVGSAP
jgi:hypothetical protein